MKIRAYHTIHGMFIGEQIDKTKDAYMVKNIGQVSMRTHPETNKPMFYISEAVEHAIIKNGEALMDCLPIPMAAVFYSGPVADGIANLYRDYADQMRKRFSKIQLATPGQAKAIAKKSDKVRQLFKP